MPSEAFSALVDDVNFHEEIDDLHSRLSSLALKTSSPYAANRLVEYMDALDERSLKLLKLKINANTADLKKAADKLAEAKAAADEAIVQIDKTQEVLTQVAAVLGILDQLILIAGGVIA